MKLPLVLTVIILAAGAFVGIQESSHLAVLRQTHRQVLLEAEKLEVSIQETGPSPAGIRTAPRPQQDAERKAAAMAAALAKFAKEMKDMKERGQASDQEMKRRIVQLMDDMFSLKGDELKMLVTRLRESPEMDDGMRQGLISFSIMMLAEKHPQTALALFTESSELLGQNGAGTHVLAAALTQWAKDQPLDALDWINKNDGKHPELINDATKSAIIAGAANRDFRLALELIGELKLGPEKVMDRLAQVATTPEQQTEFLNALRNAAAKANDKESAAKLLEPGLRSLMGRVAPAGYDAAMKWIESAKLEPSERLSMAENLQYFHTKEDTGKWLDWAASQPLDDAKAQQISNALMRTWTENDYRAAGEWLVTAPTGSLKENATVAYIGAVASYEPETAAQWADTLPSTKKQDALRLIYDELKRKDPASAKNFANSHSLEVAP